jgi:hypothetical protein
MIGGRASIARAGARALRSFACGRVVSDSSGALWSAASSSSALLRGPPVAPAWRGGAGAGGAALGGGVRGIFGQTFEVGKITVKTRDGRGTKCVYVLFARGGGLAAARAAAPPPLSVAPRDGVS